MGNSFQLSVSQRSNVKRKIALILATNPEPASSASKAELNSKRESVLAICVCSELLVA